MKVPRHFPAALFLFSCRPFPALDYKFSAKNTSCKTYFVRNFSSSSNMCFLNYQYLKILLVQILMLVNAFCFCLCQCCGRERGLRRCLSGSDGSQLPSGYKVHYLSQVWNIEFKKFILYIEFKIFIWHGATLQST